MSRAVAVVLMLVLVALAVMANGGSQAEIAFYWLTVLGTVFVYDLVPMVVQWWLSLGRKDEETARRLRR